MYVFVHAFCVCVSVNVLRSMFPAQMYMCSTCVSVYLCMDSAYVYLYISFAYMRVLSLCLEAYCACVFGIVHGYVLFRCRHIYTKVYACECSVHIEYMYVHLLHTQEY
jgi:hypothetical protein